MRDEETKRMMAQLAGDYDQLSKDADRIVTQMERDEEEANRFRRRQAITSLLATPFSDARRQQAIEALMKAHFSHARAR
jgi:hypothetical protein